jgi:hypothetical protein
MPAEIPAQSRRKLHSGIPFRISIDPAAIGPDTGVAGNSGPRIGQSYGPTKSLLSANIAGNGPESRRAWLTPHSDTLTHLEG